MSIKYKKFTDVWQEKHGKLPERYEIIHLDGNHLNNSFENLAVRNLNG